MASLARTVEEERQALAELQEEVEGKRLVWRDLRISAGGGRGEGGKDVGGEEGEDSKEGGEKGAAE